MTTSTANGPRTQAQASAPGSLMVFGEHAVLHGHLAICCAIDRRITVTATRRSDGRVRVVSALGERETTMASPDCAPPFQFALQVVGEFAREQTKGLAGGVALNIESEFRDDQGLGSSAAVTVATHAALDLLHGHFRSHRDLLERCRGVVRRVQGIGSGADVAASILGGVVAYRAEPLEMHRIAGALELVAAYSGAKEKTAVVVAKVDGLRARHPDPVERIYRAMDAVARDAATAIGMGDWQRVGELMNIGQGLMEAIGVSTPKLAGMLEGLRATPGILGGKISGSGLGDCVIALGKPDGATLPLLPVAVSGRGVEHR